MGPAWFLVQPNYPADTRQHMWQKRYTHWKYDIFIAQALLGVSRRLVPPLLRKNSITPLSGSCNAGRPRWARRYLDQPLSLLDCHDNCWAQELHHVYQWAPRNTDTVFAPCSYLIVKIEAACLTDLLRFARELDLLSCVA